MTNQTRKPLFSFIDHKTNLQLIQVFKATSFNSHCLPLVPLYQYDNLGNPVAYVDSYFYSVRVPISEINPTGLFFDFFYTDLHICLQDSISSYTFYNGSAPSSARWVKGAFRK